MNKTYKNQVKLLLDVLAVSTQQKCFALKGGTAINLFYRNMPRYSVDIDFCYLPIEDRSTTYKNIHKALSEIKTNLQEKLKLKINASKPLKETNESKLVVFNQEVEIKIEPNYILRGHIHPTKEKSLCSKASQEFSSHVSVQCLHEADVYGGKLCAALDRQHPRDLFDVKLLLEDQGITENIRHSFIYHLISVNRPIHELLDPNELDIKISFEKEFEDMSLIPISLKELLDTREELFSRVRTLFSKKEQEFLLSFASNQPNWALFPYPDVKGYPSVKWKLFNQDRMTQNKRNEQLNELEKVFL